VNPAQAVGAFVREWREQWAGLSRSQFAIAASAAIPRERPVSAATVREWERGQPPKSAAELMALLGVMQRNGLTQAEADEVRRTVFLGLAARQYPELLDDGRSAWRADIDEVAWELRAAVRARVRMALIPLVALLTELRELVLTDAEPSAPQDIRRKREAALCLLTATLAEQHDLSGRRSLAATTWRGAADLTETLLGVAGAPAYDLSVPGIRSASAFVLSHWSRSRADAQELLEVAQLAKEVGDAAIATQAFSKGLHCLAEVDGAQTISLNRELEAYLAAAEQLGPTEESNAYWQSCWAWLAQDRLEDVERGLERISHWRESPGEEGALWEWVAGVLCWRQGQYDASRRHMETAMASEWAASMTAEERRRVLETSGFAGDRTTRPDYSDLLTGHPPGPAPGKRVRTRSPRPQVFIPARETQAGAVGRSVAPCHQPCQGKEVRQ
jgi:hypothetical protein